MPPVISFEYHVPLSRRSILLQLTALSSAIAEKYDCGFSDFEWRFLLPTPVNAGFAIGSSSAPHDAESVCKRPVKGTWVIAAMISIRCISSNDIHNISIGAVTIWS